MAVETPAVADDSANVVVPDPPQLNPETIKALGNKLATDFTMYETDRRPSELRWARNLRLFLGRYDEDVEREIPKERSKAFPKLTRVKCVSMVSRLMNMLFPSSEKNWGLDASPVPNLTEEDLNVVLAQLQQDASVEVTDEAVTDAVREFAVQRAKNLELEIEDQLTELGGARTVDYVALCKKVLMSGVMYGAGVLKGPMTRSRMQRRWTIDPNTKQVTAVNEPILVPQFEFCRLWDYYPDMSANYLYQMDGQFQRIVMSRNQVRKLADNSMFMKAAILKYLAEHQEGNYKQKPFEQEIKSLGVHTNVPTNDKRKYEILVWDGMLSGHYLKGCGVDISEDKLADMVQAVVWVLDSVPIRASLNPWAIVGEEEPPPSYHVFIFEEDESGLMGTGLPHIMRDSALGVGASVRMLIDNASVVCGDQVEVNTNLLVPGTDVTGMAAYKVWPRDDDSVQTMGIPAVRAIALNSHIPELLQLTELFQKFADSETFVNPATGGDMQSGPSEPFRTAAGASMIEGKSALPFKDVVRNFDVFTESVIGSLVTFNKYFNTKPSLKGDFQVISRGSSSLVAKEVRGMMYDQYAQSLQPEERIYVDWYPFAKNRAVIRDMDGAVIVNEVEAKRREKAQADAQQAKEAQNTEMVHAEIRKVLAEAVKNLTQSDKNTAATDATTYNAMLVGLEKGVTPTDVAEARVSGHVPDGIAAVHQLVHPPKPPAPVAKKGAK